MCLDALVFFSRPFACLWEKSKKHSLSKASKQVVSLFRVADVALPDRKWFCVRGVVVRLPGCLLRGRRSSFAVSILLLCGKRSISDVMCHILFANQMVRAA